MKTTKKSKSLNQKSDKSIKTARQETERNVNAMMHGQAAINQLMMQTTNAAKAKPTGFPDAHTPYTHNSHARLVTEISAANDGDTFSAVVAPNPKSILGVYSAKTPAMSTLTCSDKFFAGTDNDGNSYFNNSMSPGHSTDDDAAGYGYIPNTAGTTSVDLTSVRAEDSVMIFTGPNGPIVSNALGWFDQGENFVAGANTITLSYTSSNAQDFVGSSPAILSVYGNSIGTTTGQVLLASATNADLSPNNTLTVVFTPTSTQRYIKFNLRVSGQVVANPLGRSILTMNSTWSGASVSGGYQYQSVPGWSVAQEAMRAVRCVALNVLVTCQASDFNNGGQIAGVQVGSDFSDAASIATYDLIAPLPNAYNGALKKGVFGFWLGDSITDYQFVPLEVSDDQDRPFLAIAGRFDSAGGSVRIQVDAHFEWITEQQIFGPTPSRVCPVEIEERAVIMAQVPCHFCENPLHPKLQAILAKATAAYHKAKPYLSSAYDVGKTIAPMLAPLLLL